MRLADKITQQVAQLRRHKQSNQRTTVPTTQANNKPSENQSSDNKQSNANSNQQSNSAIPKDGEAVYKRVKNGRTTTIKYYFKDDIVYLQEAVYAYNPQTLGKSEEETQQIVKKDTPFTTE